MKPKPSPVPEATLAPGLRRYLFLTAATTGAGIMIVEILGAKMLAPYFGTSHFVWTAQIAVTLLALASGYYLGGRWVDRSAQLARLYTAIVAAAAYLALTVAAVKQISFACLEAGLAAGSLLAALILYFVPLCLLAMTGPFLVRVITTSLAGVGGNVGRLTAISTLGSVAGTLLIGYVLIPFLPNSLTMYLTALGLMLLAAGYYAAWAPRRKAAATVALLMLLTAAGAWATQRTEGFATQYVDEIFRANSNFGLLQVLQVKDSPRRYYLNDFLTQNTYDTNRHQGLSMFTYALHSLARGYAPKVDDVLCIGMGIGLVPMDFAREGARVEVVEINPAIVPVAQKFFDLDPTKFTLHIGDGRQFLNETTNRYDAVVLDAFLGDSSPSHLMTREAFEAIRHVLRMDGVLVINAFADPDPGNDFFAASLSKTLTAVFPTVRIHRGNSGNTLYVGSLRTNAEPLREPDYAAMHPAVTEQVREAFRTLRETDPAHGRVLTDDFNPVEFFDARNREKTRLALAQGMKE